MTIVSYMFRTRKKIQEIGPAAGDVRVEGRGNLTYVYFGCVGCTSTQPRAFRMGTLNPMFVSCRKVPRCLHIKNTNNNTGMLWGGGYVFSLLKGKISVQNWVDSTSFSMAHFSPGMVLTVGRKKTCIDNIFLFLC